MSKLTQKRNGDSAAEVLIADSALDILTYDNQAILLGVVAGINLPSAAIPAGVTQVLVSWHNPNVGVSEVCFIRWNTTANNTTCMRLKPGDTFILEVPESGSRQLNGYGNPGLTPGTAISITPLG